MISIQHGVTLVIDLTGVFVSARAQEAIAGEVGVITFVQGAVTLAHS